MPRMKLHSLESVCEKLKISHDFAMEVLANTSKGIVRSGNSLSIQDAKLLAIMSTLSRAKAVDRRKRRTIAKQLNATPQADDPLTRDFYNRLLQGYVYFFECEQFVKIGYSDTPDRRIAQARVNNPFEVRVLGMVSGTRENEREWHRKWRHCWHRGEWFRATDELLAEIKKAVKSPEGITEQTDGGTHSLSEINALRVA